MYCPSLNNKLTLQQKWPEKTFQTEAFSVAEGKTSVSPTSAFKAVFIGEEGADTGALRKEFFDW